MKEISDQNTVLVQITRNQHEKKVSYHIVPNTLQNTNEHKE